MLHYIVTVFCAGDSPKNYDLDSFQKEYVCFGRGAFHEKTESIPNDIAIPPNITAVSRTHAFFHKSGDSWEIVDEHSVNGLSIDGRKVSSAKLRDGLRIWIGNQSDLSCVLAVSCVQADRHTAHADVGARMISLQQNPRCTIGRSKECNVVISHPSASRVHAIIEHTADGYVLRDNHSTNGINLNGIPLTEPTVLKEMDRFTIADMVLLFSEQNLYSTVSMGGVGVRAVELCKAVPAKKGQKLITDHVNLSIDPGEFVAIIGGSGAGKTTLVNCLSGMTSFTSGMVYINGDPISSGLKTLKSIIGYVPQRDIVYDDLTLERMLHYSARLRMADEATQEEIEKKIHEILKIVDLSAHRDTLIGKLSGGQKKRASIAVELLSDPKLFFLDEPFSGLDPGTEKKLMGTLKKISDSGHTVIMITHSVMNLEMCSRVVCMGRGGRLCYSGKPDQVCRYFGVESVADIFDQLDNNSAACAERVRSSLAPGETDAVPRTSKGNTQKGKKCGNRLRQFGILSARYTEITCNQRGRLLLLLAMPVILTLFVCAAFQLDGGLSNKLYNLINAIPFLSANAAMLSKNSHPFLVYGDTQSAMLTFACAAFWIGIFNTIQEISKERQIYQREAFTGVHTTSYIGSKLVVATVLCVVQAAIMTIILVCLAKTVQTRDGDVSSFTALANVFPSGGVVFTKAIWLELYITTLLTMLSAMCLGLLISAVCSNDMALVICPVALLPQILFSGIISELTGLAQKISNIISCNWAVRAFCTSVNINELREKVKFSGVSWDLGEVVSGEAKYSVTTHPILGLNPVCSSWVILSLLCIACILGAVIALHMQSGVGASLQAWLQRKKAQSGNKK